jgi:hypothetical protein
MTELCCLLSPEWACAHCEWKMCRSHWTGSSGECHNLASPKCIISYSVNANKITTKTGIKESIPYTLILKKEDSNV